IALTPNKDLTGTNSAAKSTIHSLIKISDLPMTYFDGSNNISMDNKTFYVVGSGSTFSLALTPGGSVLALTAQSGAGFNHSIGPENVGLLSVGSGLQTVRIDLVDPTAPSGTLLGPGGVDLNIVSPPSGDGISSSKSVGSSGGFISGIVNSSTLKFNPTVTVSVAGQVNAVNDIKVSGHTTTNGTAYSTNASGG